MSNLNSDSVQGKNVHCDAFSYSVCAHDIMHAIPDIMNFHYYEALVTKKN